MKEYVVLVDEQNQPIGTTDKAAVHTDHTPLHRGFSVFIFNAEGKVLLQQRSHKKKTWPLEWSNSCCGHPMLEESSVEAAKRRLQDELGLTEVALEVILPKYRYRAEKYGIVENEFCPVMVGVTHQNPELNPDEVEVIEWLVWREFIDKVKIKPQSLSPWCVEEAILLSKDQNFLSFCDNHHISTSGTVT